MVSYIARGLFVENDVYRSGFFIDIQRFIECVHVAPAIVHPVDGPRVVVIGAIAHVFGTGGNVEKLVRPDDVSPIADFKPSFPTEAIDEDIVRAVMLALPVMEGCVGEVADMGDQKLAQQRIVCPPMHSGKHWAAG